jgi:hypothetical protein
MGYIKEPKGIDFVVEPTVLTQQDKKFFSEVIATYKANGKITRAPKKKARTSGSQATTRRKKAS